MFCNFEERGFRKFLSILFPDRCFGCGDSIPAGREGDRKSPFPVFPKGFLEDDLPMVFRDAMKSMVCPACLDTFSPVLAPYCTSCGVVFTSREGKNRMCGACLKKAPRYSHARAAGLFEGSLMEAVHRFKYQGKTRLEKPLSQLLLFCLMVHAHEFTDSRRSIDLVTPVPLHPRRFRERGFNQAYLLIRNWQKMARENGITLPILAIERQVLVRQKYTTSQTGLKREERKKNIEGAFRLSPKITVQGKQILLVDDVYTTGATVNECARVLLKGGARRVDVLTLARTV